MSYKCEHDKDSDICAQCWEEKNLEPRTMKEPTELQQAVETPRTEAAKFIIYDEYEQIVDVVDPEFARGLELELLSNAKQLSILQRANEELKYEFAMSYTGDGLGLVEENLKLRIERDSLTAVLKECAEAVKRGSEIGRAFRYSMDRAVPFPSLDKLNEIISMQEKALSNPQVQKLLKP